jgi:hypothetical protein
MIIFGRSEKIETSSFDRFREESGIRVQLKDLKIQDVLRHEK